MKLNSKQIDAIQGTIISSFIANHYINEVLSFKMPMVKHGLKKSLNDSVKQLDVIESNYFDKIEEAGGEDLHDKITANTMDFLKLLLSLEYSDFVQFQQILQAYKIDRERIELVTQDILTRNK